MKSLKTLGLAGAALLIASPALAHPGHGATSGFAAGIVHPFLGTDHLLAMVTVGLWAAHYGTRKGLALPFGFVGGMLAGATTGFFGVGLPGAESVIALSLVLLGAALALKTRLPVMAAAGLTFAAGLFHGHAHAVEASGSALAYVAGFVVATSLLHAAGGLAGWRLAALRLAAPLAGGAVALAGLAMLAG
ncbi:HupE / UreJ protein [Hartmannibacter diazotrophicus]|uniref:HupE / UreJ protein n=1 Tax=Hartmannibacter diazotrophicus TaxID=1482074 RepID=A0A2C9D130_9HYPH|nr:HupE/UreJ family protein [Hartmannibacter diazotrophicus]SON53960.1 HupE / UreJ protein [Hartmannibacter diazotrophicus]